MKKLSLIDYMFLGLETPESPSHAASLQIFQIPEGYRGNFVRNLLDVYRDSEVGPPFNYKLKPALAGRPSLVEDESLDLDYHIRHSAVPEPGTTEDLMKLVSQFHCRLLDRSRPLWESYLIEGLQNRRFALYTKFHHAIMDGAGFLHRIVSALSTSPEDKTVRYIWQPLPELVHEERLAVAPGVAQQVVKTVRRIGAQASAIPELSRSLLKMGLQAAGRRHSHIPAPFTAPRTLLNAPITAARRLAVNTLSLGRIKAIGEATDATINDVVLAIIDGALNRYLRERKALPDRPLVAVMPMDVRRGGDTQAGNQIAILLVILGSPDASPLARLREIKRSTTEAKTDARNMSVSALTLASLLPQGFAQILDRLKLSRKLPPLANVIVSDVQGYPYRFYLNGAPMMHFYPVSMIRPDLLLNITVISYAGTMEFGLIADGHALPDLDVLARCLGDALEELEAAVGPGKESVAHANAK